MGVSRRRVLLWGASATAGMAAAAGGAAWWQARPTLQDRALRFATLEEALLELDRLADPAPLSSDVAFTWAQTLAHAAQSIEYSLLGYPEAKPALFQATVGRAAFAVFSGLGRMHHGLGEPIPGAPAISAGIDSSDAAQRLRRAIEDFRGWSGPLAPHFAYGALDKAQYAQAHAMHLAEHFSLFDAAEGRG